MTRSRLSHDEACQRLGMLQHQLQQIIIGQNQTIHHLLAALLSNGHVLLEGVPGLGKTRLINALAHSLDLPAKRIQFTADLMPSDVLGHSIYDSATQRFILRKGPAFTHLLLADEINRAPAKTQAALLEVMQERQITLDGERHDLPAPFMVLATQNPIEQAGTYALPESELDRFMLSYVLDYPGQDAEISLVTLNANPQQAEQSLNGLKTLLNREDILALQQQCQQLTMASSLVGYAVSLVRQTRDNSDLAHGAGPRASIALVQAARANALLAGRDHVLPEDIQAMASAVLRHRIALSSEAAIAGISTEAVIQRIIDDEPVPRG